MRLRFGTCVFDSGLRELTRDGSRVPLTPKAFTLLEVLVTAAPQPRSKEDLADILWPDTTVETGNLHNLVAEIRKAIGDDDHEVIRTVHRFGYAFEAAGTVEETPRFVVFLGRDQIPLRSGENMIGRDPEAAIVISAPDVSRHHARLILDQNKVTLEDLRSKNGTFVGTTRVSSPVVVAPGETIVIGTTHLRLERVGVLPPTRTAL
ncbi:MAG TPA: FHA domain-containing protein [Thermoanaerobaculia bacterium]|nr:FHA domain-containing protein [Thermoanaerobaculia bacterium]